MTSAYEAGNVPPLLVRRITITDAEGVEVVEWVILGDPYGCGVSTQYGFDTFGEYTVRWQDFTPDWLAELPPCHSNL
jgi:hypothetical protein